MQFLLDFFTEVFTQLISSASPFETALVLFFNGGWIIVLYIAFTSFKDTWRDWRQGLYHDAKRRFILLAIDVPRDNEQSPKAVENIFSHLHGALPGRNNRYEEWWLGKTPDYFSMELISIEGYVQFLVYTQEEYRDLVESAFYAQYPDAEITQVEDYVHGTNGEFLGMRFPNDEYMLLGSEIVLAHGNNYPIRLHPEFEHSLSQEFKDPMASLLETMNKMGPGEQLWFQIVITPEYDSAWRPAAEKAAMTIAGKKVDSPTGPVDKLVSALLGGIDKLGTAAFPFYEATEISEERELPSLMLHLTPSEKAQIEAIQLKSDKLAYWCKFRYMYLAKKKVGSKARGIAQVMGALKQFSSLNLNALTPHKYTKTWGLDYLFVDRRVTRRQNNLIRAFQDRGRSAGSSGIILNTEELATIYHFPTEVVKAPLVSRTQAKRASAPTSLPIENSVPGLTRVRPSVRPSAGGRANAPAELPEPISPPSAPPPAAAEQVPDNLPFV